MRFCRRNLCTAAFRHDIRKVSWPTNAQHIMATEVPLSPTLTPTVEWLPSRLRQPDLSFTAFRQRLKTTAILWQFLYFCIKYSKCSKNWQVICTYVPLSHSPSSIISHRSNRQEVNSNAILQCNMCLTESYRTGTAHCQWATRPGKYFTTSVWARLPVV